MNKTLLKMAAVGTFVLGAHQALAIPTGNLGGLQTALNNLTTAPNPGTSSVDVTTDYMVDGSDAYWSVGASGGSVSTMMIELAGFTQNTFGIYDRANPNSKVELFSAGNGVGSIKLLSILANGGVLVNGVPMGSFSGNEFGFYLGVPQANSTFYSDTLLNADGADHMAAYRGVGDTLQIPPFAPGVWGPNEYALAWEDLPASWPSDYNFTDMVVLVESITPAPDGGATAALLGLSVAGLSLVRRRKA